MKIDNRRIEKQGNLKTAYINRLPKYLREEMQRKLWININTLYLWFFSVQAIEGKKY